MRGRRAYIRVTRRIVQAGFVAFTVLICVKLYSFIFQFDPASGYSGPYIERPTGVDAFLPIGGFMELKYFIFTLGNIEPSHPAALVFFVAIAVSAMFVKKGFCGWICPVGTLSEYVSIIGATLFGGNKTMPRKADLGLMSIKYLLMLAFVFLILVMPASYMVLFFMQEEYKLMDGRMLLFFMDASNVTLIVLGSLFVLTLFYTSFWCRYLCPYGALLGFLSYLSPFKVRRVDDKCTHCKACTKNCPMQVGVEQQEVVTSAECFGCMSCVSHCPEEGALDMTFKPRKTIYVLKRPLMYTVVLFAVFYGFVGAGMALGVYKSRLPVDEYKKAVPFILEKRKGAQPSSQSSSSVSSGSERAQPSSQSSLSGSSGSSSSRALPSSSPLIIPAISPSSESRSSASSGIS
jgi:ferredoxin